MSRFILIGMDGAEPSLLEPWMDEGRLPNLARLRDQGACLPCRSTTPPATFPAWTTCVTGLNPGQHGIIVCTMAPPGTYGLRFVNATHRKAPALWNILSDAGKRVGVLGVPGSYPPEPVNGFLVSGFDSPVCTAVDRSFVYPESLYPLVRDWRFADIQESVIDAHWHDRALPKLLEGIATKERIALDLLQRDPLDFFMIVFGESDTVAHHYWMFHDPGSPRFRPGHETAIRQVYERLDAAVGKLVKAFREDAVVGVVSDHGFGGAGTGVVHLNNWLAREDYLWFTGEREGSMLKRLALRCVPASWQGAAFRRFQGAAARAESASRFGGIDWAHTLAYSEELNYFPSVRLNLEGREPNGQVAPEDYDRVRDELCQRLEGWACVDKAWRREELYHGPGGERAPDIILGLALEDGYSHSCLRSRGGPPFRRIGPDEYLGGKERGMNGTHRPVGVLLLSEPPNAAEASLEDVAPTVLAAMNVPAPPMEGHSLLGDGGTQSESQAYAPEEAPYTPEQEAALEARLRALGYLE